MCPRCSGPLTYGSAAVINVRENFESTLTILLSRVVYNETSENIFLHCHPRERGDQIFTRRHMDSRLRGNDKTGESFRGLSVCKRIILRNRKIRRKG